MYFDEPAAAFDQPLSPAMNAVLVVTSVLVLAFFIYPAPVADSAAAAAATLFSG